MDAALGRFLAWVRPRTRPGNLAAYEDAVIALDEHLRRRRRRAAAITPRDVQCVAGGAPRWFDAPQGTRRFCAALRLVVRWLAHTQDAAKAPALRAAATRTSREATRAARAAAGFGDGASHDDDGDVSVALDGYWIVVLRAETHAVVRALGTSHVVGPVALPRDVLRLLPPGAAINMRLVRTSRVWRVLEHGPCYPAAALPALRQSLRVVRA